MASIPVLSDKLIQPGFVAMVILALGFSFAGAQDSLTPKEHFKIEKPVRLSADEANQIYRDLITKMAAGYALSGIREAKEFMDWQRENTVPYLSAGHGNRFLNNYSNKIGKDYLKLGRGETMPVGTILAKDSFTVTSEKEIFPGALFLMEKLPKNQNTQSGNWRYVMIMPDGSLLGDSAVKGDDSMKFCHDCHKRAKSRDYLFLIPKKYRADHGG